MPKYRHGSSMCAKKNFLFVRLALFVLIIAPSTSHAQFKVTPTPSESNAISELKKSIAVSERIAKEDSGLKPKAVSYAEAARHLGQCNLHSDASAASLYQSRIKTMTNDACRTPGTGIKANDFQNLVNKMDQADRSARRPASESTRVNGAAAQMAKTEQAKNGKAHLAQERDLLRNLLYSFDEEVRGPTEKALVSANAYDQKTTGKEAQTASELNRKMEAVNQLCERLKKSAYQEAKKSFDSNSPKANRQKIEAAAKSNAPLLHAAFQGVLSDPHFQALMGSETFQKSAGLEHVAQGTALDTCQKNGVAFFIGGRKELDILNVEKDKNLLTADSMIKAKKEVRVSIENQLSAQNKIQRELLSKDFLSLSDEAAVKKMTEQLSKHIATHPIAFANILKKQPSFEMADELCFLSRKGLSNDVDREHLNTLIMVAGVASLPASFLMPGAGAALLSLGMFGALDIGAGVTTLKQDQERLKAYQGAMVTDLIHFSEGYSGAAKASASIDMTTLSLVLASGGAVNDLRGLSQGLAKTLARAHPSFSKAEVGMLDKMLKDNKSEAEIASYFGRNPASDAAVVKDAMRAPASETAAAYQKLEQSFVKNGSKEGIPAELLKKMNDAHVQKVRMPDGTLDPALMRQKVEKINKVESELAVVFGPEKARKMRKELTDSNVLGIQADEAMAAQRKKAVEDLYHLESNPAKGAGFHENSADQLTPGTYAIVGKNEKGENIYGTVIEKASEKWNRKTVPETVTAYKITYELADGTKATKILDAAEKVPVSALVTSNQKSVALGAYSKQTGQVMEVNGKAEPLSEFMMRKTAYQAGAANHVDDFVTRGDQISVKGVDGEVQEVEFRRRTGDFIWVKTSNDSKEIAIADSQIAQWNVMKRTEHSSEDIKNASLRPHNSLFQKIPTLQEIPTGRNIFESR